MSRGLSGPDGFPCASEPARPLTTETVIESARIATFFDHWNQLKGAAALPNWTDFDVVAVPQLMPYIMVVDVTLDPVRVFFRLVGTKVAEVNGYDFTGSYLDSLLTDTDNGFLHTLYGMAARDKVPAMERFAWHVSDGISSTYDLAVFPFALDADATRHRVLCVECYDRLERSYDPHHYMRPRRDKRRP